VAIIALAILAAVVIRRRAARTAASALQARVVVDSLNPIVAAGLSTSQVLMFGTKGQYVQDRGMKVDAGVVCPTGERKPEGAPAPAGSSSSSSRKARGGGGSKGTHVVPRASTLKALQEQTRLSTVVKDAANWGSVHDSDSEDGDFL
jgi:hypothetical protein